jgi:DNA-binding HxlR family transcriptional regulator
VLDAAVRGLVLVGAEAGHFHEGQPVVGLAVGHPDRLHRGGALRTDARRVGAVDPIHPDHHPIPAHHGVSVAGGHPEVVQSRVHDRLAVHPSSSLLVLSTNITVWAEIDKRQYDVFLYLSILLHTMGEVMSEVEDARRQMRRVLTMISGKWKMEILWLLDQRTHRFGELRREIPQVTQHMLTKQLRELESDGLVERKVYAEVPPRVEYKLTDKAWSLRPVFESLLAWAVSQETSQN